ncbi:MAG: hypothetical protein QOK29_667 [Rhodospirillaceae bacterium]|nr:hypothetical protein [Rhodospirillaceae bacterium]
MKSSAEMRQEAQRLLLAAKSTSDKEFKNRLLTLVFRLACTAEMLEYGSIRNDCAAKPPASQPE